MSSPEPNYIAQTTPEQIEKDGLDVQAWIQLATLDARDKGSTFFRTAWTEVTDGKIILLEGWKERPDEQGAPRFGITYAPTPQEQEEA